MPAAACYKRAVDVGSEPIYAVMCAGECLAKAGLFKDAPAEFDRAVELEPGMSLAHMSRRSSLSSLGRHPEAAASYEAATDADPGNPLLRAAKALCYGRDGMAAKGRDSLARARP